MSVHGHYWIIAIHNCYLRMDLCELEGQVCSDFEQPHLFFIHIPNFWKDKNSGINLVS